jgi:hypothetical protein
VNNAAARGSGPCDVANSCHDSKKDGQRPAEVRFVKRLLNAPSVPRSNFTLALS